MAASCSNHEPAAISAVAERARVSAETIYATYRSKPGLLGAVIRAAVTRGEEPEDPLHSGCVKELLDLPNLDRARLEREALRRLARENRE